MKKIGDTGHQRLEVEGKNRKIKFIGFYPATDHSFPQFLLLKVAFP